MNGLVKIAIDTFQTMAKFNPENGQWLADNVQKVMEDLIAIPEGERVNLNQYIIDNFGAEKRDDFMGNLLPYLTGGYGVLDMGFETKDGKKVVVANWLLTEKVGEENVNCTLEDGTPISNKEVYIVFKRNSTKDVFVKKWI